jgi:hypothetical protein
MRFFLSSDLARRSISFHPLASVNQCAAIHQTLHSRSLNGNLFYAHGLHYYATIDLYQDLRRRVATHDNRLKRSQSQNTLSIHKSPTPSGDHSTTPDRRNCSGKNSTCGLQVALQNQYKHAARASEPTESSTHYEFISSTCLQRAIQIDTLR